MLTVLVAVLLACVVSPRSSHAQVQLPTVNLGLTNFEDGFAVPGWFLQEFPNFYDANELKDSNGATVPGRNRLTANSTTTHLVYVTQQHLFGGWLGFEALQPLVDLDVRLANGVHSRVRGLGDLTLGAGVQWAPVNFGSAVFAHRFMLDVGVPTGKYDDQQPVNIGNHFVVLNPYYAFTVERQAVEFSARLHYLWNSTNHDPYTGFGLRDVQAGQAFHVNYSLSYEVIKDLRVGFNGYWLQQLTEHKVDGAGVTGSLERTVGLGGGVQYFAGRNTWLHLNGYSETDVRNRAKGFEITLRLSKGIPSMAH